MILKHKVYLTVITILLSLLSINLTGCFFDYFTSESPEDSEIKRETLVQVSTIDALLNGAYDGVMTYEQLKEYGDFGIGTFQGLNGEMVAFDGKYYQVKADGVAYPVLNPMETPFACVTYFDADYEEKLAEGTNYEGFQKFMDTHLPTLNTFYAIKIEGIFDHVKTRSVPEQKKPYPPLVEVTRDQPVFEFDHMYGTIVGFRCPVYVAGVNVTGYHLHFLTVNRLAGGHVLDFTVKQATASADSTSNFLLMLPAGESDFYKIDLSQDKQEELEKAEK